MRTDQKVRAEGHAIPHARGRGPIALGDIHAAELERFSLGLPGLDAVLGGGMVKGGAVLLSGDPGCGKSTLLMQALSHVADQPGSRALYVTGEENEEQIKDRSERLGGISPHILLFPERDVDTILEIVDNVRPTCLVVDSAQVLNALGVDGIAGGVTQIKHCTGLLVEQCKRLRTSLLLVCHVTKDGGLAGPKTLEHLVDAVLSLDRGGGESRTLTCPDKNRFGATDVHALFEMGEKGLRGIGETAR